MAQGRKTQIRVVLMKEIRRELESWQRSSTISAGLARRGRIILLLADRTAISEVSRLVGIEVSMRKTPRRSPRRRPVYSACWPKSLPGSERPLKRDDAQEEARYSEFDGSAVGL